MFAFGAFGFAFKSSSGNVLSRWWKQHRLWDIKETGSRLSSSRKINKISERTVRQRCETSPRPQRPSFRQVFNLYSKQSQFSTNLKQAVLAHLRLICHSLRRRGIFTIRNVLFQFLKLSSTTFKQPPLKPFLASSQSWKELGLPSMKNFFSGTICMGKPSSLRAQDLS